MTGMTRRKSGCLSAERLQSLIPKSRNFNSDITNLDPTTWKRHQMSSLEAGNGPTHRQRRARKACAECNRRKVRCNVALVGQPCGNCTADGAACEVIPRKQRRARNRKAASLASTTSEPRGDVTHGTEPATAEISVAWGPDGGGEDPLIATAAACEEEDEGENAGALAAAVEDHTGDQHDDQTAIYYTGNTHGAVSFVADLVGGGNTEQGLHYLVPYTIRKTKSPEDLEYLRYKGVFSVPSRDVCDTLIRTYFLHVHPVLPILDASTFLAQFTQHGCSNVNLLLLWSMIFMAAGFVEPDTLQRSGFASRKALKRAAYQRAKALYDNAYDDDQITLIQSVILMGHWHADAEDRFEAWHWTGIAISLCQTAGLHCSLGGSTKKSSQLTEARERLCRRIWWTCIYRDRWLSMVKGRPVRIRLEDGDMSPATVEDMEHDIRQLPDTVKAAYFPYDSRRVSSLWCKQVEIGLLLGNILTQNARLQASTPVELTQPSELDLLQCDWPVDDVDGMHPFERLCEYHVRLLYHATCIAFWRPRISLSGDGPSEHPWRREAVEKSRAAAVNSNAVLEEIMAHDLLKFMKSQSISALVPPMQIHLLDSKSSTTSVRILGTNRLQLCLQILAELKETYWAAEFALKLFERAYKKIVAKRQKRQAGQIPPSSQVPLETYNNVPAKSIIEQNPTPESLGSADDVFMPGYSLEGNSEMESLWNQILSAEDSGLNSFFNAEEFSASAVIS
ncbi:hypothetical protein FZEAL_4544 [Fusarium zealandicum]|uniref:Zn(2)-C6 fungal-type domain-containing protein n=1 Tax=Fusarium zealandicum TaxID=1053134 RepID=A0A8H4UM56_9HYPO|nr:hypothetical protein FZEAL_4544 [Fusarium zealandicum]